MSKEKIEKTKSSGPIARSFDVIYEKFELDSRSNNAEVEWTHGNILLIIAYQNVPVSWQNKID